jgi:ATP/ADP translocase
MAIKIIVSGLLIFMVYNLFRAMVVMLKNESTEPMSKYIGRRVITSALIVIVLLIAVATGLITPNPRPY